MTKTDWSLLAVTLSFVLMLTAMYGRDRGSSDAMTYTITTVRAAAEPTAPQVQPISLNIGDIDELMLLPGVGEVIAQRIIDYREEHGPFQTIEEIMNVSGIGEATFADIKDQITVRTSWKKGIPARYEKRPA